MKQSILLLVALFAINTFAGADQGCRAKLEKIAKGPWNWLWHSSQEIAQAKRDLEALIMAERHRAATNSGSGPMSNEHGDQLGGINHGDVQGGGNHGDTSYGGPSGMGGLGGL